MDIRDGELFLAFSLPSLAYGFDPDGQEWPLHVWTSKVYFQAGRRLRPRDKEISALQILLLFKMKYILLDLPLYFGKNALPMDVYLYFISRIVWNRAASRNKRACSGEILFVCLFVLR